MEEVELRGIVKRFAQSGWDLIAQPAKSISKGRTAGKTGGSRPAGGRRMRLLRLRIRRAV